MNDVWTFMRNTSMLFVACAAFLIAPPVEAALETSVWVPHWRSEKGVTTTVPNSDALTEINPFIYSVKDDGTLYHNESPLTDPEWQQLRASAQAQGIRFIPTVMWSDADAMDRIFRDETLRAAHVRAIVAEVYSHKLDGIDIDYEAKYAKTRPYFSLFLRDLYNAMGYDKWVMCTIESRTPLEARYSTPEAIPADIEYANDFVEINKYCDRVRVMAYDQGRIDLRLNKANLDPYIPVADVAWVRKVMELAAKDIAKEKLVLGIPTYGYEYDIFPDATGKMQYSKLWSFNPGYALDIAQKLGITPQRNTAGELFLIYPAAQSPDPTIPLPNATRVMSWSDAGAIQAKIALAQELGLKGVALFKADGGEDPGSWNALRVARAADVRTAAKTPHISVAQSPAQHPATSVSLSRNLETGVVGEDVRTLQQFLNSSGYTVASSGPGSPGNETTRFGALTRAAVIKYQKANGITPAIGYVGPITRAHIAQR